MARVQWAKSSQFNWVFDNMGGTPLQEAVAGNWSGAQATVGSDGTVRIQPPLPGAGRVYWLRGVWAQDTGFPWDGFWTEPLEGDLSNYYAGGSFSNQGLETVVYLGTPLPFGTPVQLYYIYLTGERALKYEPLNNYPCIRRAYRSGDDYTYDFAPDRMLDLMVTLYFAGREQERDFAPLQQFLWDAFLSRQESRTSPLMYDSFERRFWDRGAHLLYRGTTAGNAAFEIFQTESAAGRTGQALHVKAALPTGLDSAWFGYGLDWSLEQPPFSDLDRVNFTFKGPGVGRRLHNLTKVGNGSATLVLAGDYTPVEKTWFVVQVENDGEVGQALCRWSKDGGLTWEAQGQRTGSRLQPLNLWGGIQIYWESDPGLDLVAGDTWTFWAGDPAEHPRRLLVILNDSEAGATDPWDQQHTYVHALPDRFPDFTAFEIPFDQFWRRDNLIDDRDRARTMWGTWHAAAQPDDSVITLSDQEETLEFFGDTFYTQMQVIWNLSPYAMAFGVWAGIDPSRCDSTGHLNLNVLLKAQTSQANELSLRTKVKDARGSLFYQDQIVTVGTWQRLTVPFADLWLESGVAPLTHPLQAVDFGISSNPPATGVLWFTDLKFDDHVKFSGANRLRVLEFKMEQQGLPTQELWLDEVGLNLVAADPFPYTPRLAISLTPYGQNPWRGPTLVHYAQPLAPHLAGALNLSQTYVGLHREAQNEFFRRYRGVKGAILPVHTRNDVENIALCGEENFGAFCWWPARRGFGKVVASFPFNGSLQDAAREHHLTWSPGSPVYTGGICQPGQTALMFNGSGGQASCPGHEDFLLGKGDFTLEAIASFASLSSSHVLMSFWNQGNSQRSWAMLRAGKNLALHYSVTGSDYPIILAVGDLIASPATYYHLLIVRSGETVSFYVNGQVAGSGYIGSASFYPAQAQFRLGRWEYSGYLFSGNLDFVQIHKGRAMNPAEIADRWRIIQGQQNGSAYPEAGYALAQYWAFYRLAQYFFVTNDPATWDILSTWLTWLDAYGAPDGAGWQFPTYFSKYGFGYGAYDPGVTASLALGCLYIYLRNGDSRASLWARRILDDLRLHRQSLEYGGGYKSDYHYAWLNALVAQAFGLAAVGRAGEAYNFPNLPEDTAHFQSLIAWMFKHSGDVKPNLLNTDLIPFTYLEDTEVWEYAPHYVFMRQMGSLEAVVLMAGAALDYGKLSGDWTWFDRLLRFVLTDNLMRLSPAQIRDLALSYDLAGLKNRVRLRFADYDRDNSKYAEVQDQAAITAWGEQAVDLDCRYGRPVILENPDTAKLLADRLLKRLSTPWETVELTTWLEGLRTELGDTVAISSDFHGLAAEEFTVHGKAVDLARRQVHLSLARPVQTAWSWAVDADGSPYDSSAIDQPCSLDSNWPYRSYAG